MCLVWPLKACVGIVWACYRRSLGLAWAYFGRMLGVVWACCGPTMSPSWAHSGPTNGPIVELWAHDIGQGESEARQQPSTGALPGRPRSGAVLLVDDADGLPEGDAAVLWRLNARLSMAARCRARRARRAQPSPSLPLASGNPSWGSGLWMWRGPLDTRSHDTHHSRG